jgi:hypothetical protein
MLLLLIFKLWLTGFMYINPDLSSRPELNRGRHRHLHKDFFMGGRPL